jgi:hypothetical protein
LKGAIALYEPSMALFRMDGKRIQASAEEKQKAPKSQQLRPAELTSLKLIVKG